MAEICGIEADVLRDVARDLSPGCARRRMVFWGMGVSQHIHGTDNSRCLISLGADVRPYRAGPVRGCTRFAVRTTSRARPTRA